MDTTEKVAYQTEDQVTIYIVQGKKSAYDFKVLFKESIGRKRTPKHIHLIVEMYVKQAYNPGLTLKLRDYILIMFENIHGIDKSIVDECPKLQYFQPEHIEEFKELNNVGEFSVETLLVLTEFIAIQEKTNYPNGSLTEKMYIDFGNKDRFRVISEATNTFGK